MMGYQKGMLQGGGHKLRPLDHLRPTFFSIFKHVSFMVSVFLLLHFFS
jgi:hypothetical protein